MNPCPLLSMLILTISSSTLRAEPASLLDVDQVLVLTAPLNSRDSLASSEAAELLRDVQSFRAAAGALPPPQSAAQWIELADRALLLQKSRGADSYSSFDVVSGAPAGLRAVLAALPPPKAWAELRTQLARRAKANASDVRSLTLRLLGELLVQDRAASENTLEEIKSLGSDQTKQEREQIEHQVAALRQSMTDLYGEESEIEQSFLGAVDVAARSDYEFEVEAPDLVSMLGETRAELLLRKALMRPVQIAVPVGSSTRALAKRLALEEVAALARPQWALVDDIDTLRFYEAMRDRFGGASAAGVSLGYEPNRDTADAYYFIALVAEGRQQEAEQALATLTQESALSLPRAAVDALKRQGRTAALVEFLHSKLRAEPALEAWTEYLETAASVGRQVEALQLIADLLGRGDLPAHLRITLGKHQADAQLAADQLEPALAFLQDALRAPVAAGDGNLRDRLQLGIRMAALGRVLSRPDLARFALDDAEAVARTMIGSATQDYTYPDAIVGLYAELRRNELPIRAQALAISLLKRPRDAAQSEYGWLQADPLTRAAMIELVSLYGEAGRGKDALRLLDESAAWAARDLGELVAEKDSLGTPIGIWAARALAAQGDSASARTVAESLLRKAPGYDGAYALLLDLLGDEAANYFDERYGHDPFEERPLIWKAIAQQQQGLLPESEASIRAAISIDPSDGEQGRGDRMRAYSVLADLLEASGDAEGATVYRNAVASIRLSEAADELHKLGLYQRAFRSYDEALAMFSDAYCIQSRLAVQLSKQGLQERALAHYRRAYELMPDSFGRVESHCFGCESVFQDPAGQGVADQVFTKIVATKPEHPQAHYMLAYLRIEQGRHAEALELLRRAVSLDGDYLNAWKKLHELGDKIHIDAGERDIARLKLIELDPAQRHVRYEVRQIGDLRSLWDALEQAAVRRRLAGAPPSIVYPLRASESMINDQTSKLPEAMRAQVQQFQRITAEMANPDMLSTSPAGAMSRHVLFQPVLSLLGERASGDFGHH